MARRGRKRLNVKRQPNGQPYRSPEDDVRMAATNTRMRMFGLSKKDAQSELAGYAIGRMALAGWFGDSHMDAIRAVSEYCEATASYMRAKMPLQPLPKAMDYMAGRGLSLVPEPDSDRMRQIERRFTRQQEKLTSVSGIDRMRFHEAAYHDRLTTEDAHISVLVCVAALLRN